MLYAHDELGQLIEAKKGAIAYCPGCGNQVRPKCGAIVTHHWAHISGGDCDAWSEPESDWHKGWKEYFPMHCREVVMGENNEHRADVRLDNGLVIELQHSSISPETIAEREQFYGFMVWLFDAREFAKNVYISSYKDASLADLSVIEPIEKASNAAEIAVKEFQERQTEFEQALQKVNARIASLPIKVTEIGFGETAYSLIDAFGGEKEGLLAIAKIATDNRENIIKALLHLPIDYDQGPPYFNLGPWRVFAYLITGEPSYGRRVRIFEKRWQKNVLPRTTVEQRAAIGRIIRFIWSNIALSEAFYDSEEHRRSHLNFEEKGGFWSDPAVGSMLAAATVDNLYYLVAAAKLAADVRAQETQISAKRSTVYPEDIPIIRTDSSKNGLFEMRAIIVGLSWKYRRKSLLACNRPQLWDFGSQYLLYFDSITFDETVQHDESQLYGYLVNKKDFITGLICTTYDDIDR